MSSAELLELEASEAEAEAEEEAREGEGWVGRASSGAARVDRCVQTMVCTREGEVVCTASHTQLPFTCNQKLED